MDSKIFEGKEDADYEDLKEVMSLDDIEEVKMTHNNKIEIHKKEQDYNKQGEIYSLFQPFDEKVIDSYTDNLKEIQEIDVEI